jgi:hypothetical protein
MVLVMGSIFLSYTYYNMKAVEKRDAEIAAANPNKISSKNIAQPKDSAERQYSEAVQTVDGNINLATSSTVYKEATTNLEEVNNLRAEIADLLKGKNTEENVSNAQVKIYLLQEKVALLQSRFLDISEENKRLQVLLGQIVASGKLTSNNNARITKTEVAVAQLQQNEKPNMSSAAVATGLHLFAVANNNETSQSVEADKIVGTFILKNITNRTNAEVVVVVLQPDGKVLKNSVWESGTFETKEGKKVYSRKILFDADITEKQVNFSLTPDNFSKGNYTMQVWYNGSMIAKMVKILS